MRLLLTIRMAGPPEPLLIGCGRWASLGSFGVASSAGGLKLVGVTAGGSGALASGTFASGAFASGAFASGAFASGPTVGIGVGAMRSLTGSCTVPWLMIAGDLGGLLS